LLSHTLCAFYIADSTEEERAALLTIVQDETRHAFFAWQIVLWALSKEPQMIDDVLAVFVDARSELPAPKNLFINDLSRLLLLSSSNSNGGPLSYATIAAMTAPQVVAPTGADQTLVDNVIHALLSRFDRDD
jgi:hypothetical protein